MAIVDADIYKQGARLAQQQRQYDQSSIQDIIGLLVKDQQVKDASVAKQREDAIASQNDPINILRKMQMGQQVSPEQEAIAQVYTQTKINPVTGEPLFPQVGAQRQVPAQQGQPMQRQPMQQSVESPEPQMGRVSMEGLSPKGRMEAEKANIALEREAREQEFAKKKARPKLERAFESSKQTFEGLDDAIDEAIKNTDWASSGFIGDMMKGVGGSDAANLRSTLETIQADAAFSTLQNMRDNSPTGGALGAISERELALLQNARAALSQDQSAEQLKANLEKYRAIRKQALKNVGEAYKEDYGSYPKGFGDIDGKESKSENGKPKRGTVQDGYRFKGGNPALKENWEQV